MPHSSPRPRNQLWLLYIAVVLLSGWLGCKRPPPPSPEPAPERQRSRVVLLGLDGAALPFVRAEIESGRLPNFARLMREGASGHLASLYRDLPFSTKRGPGYWSPIVWTSISTGKLPEIHGVVDFLLPDPRQVRLCTQAGKRRATIRVPLSGTSADIRITVAADSAPGWRVRFAASEKLTSLVPGETVRLLLPARASTAGEALLEIARSELKTASLCLQEVHLGDGNGNRAEQLHFLLASGLYEEGWATPTFGTLHSARTAHRRVPALWNLVGEANHKVAVVGWRDAWPAETVNGYFVSDQFGMRFASKPDHVRDGPGQLFPEQLRARARPLLDRLGEVDAIADQALFNTPCEVPDLKVARVQHWDDWLSHHLALDLWTSDDDIDLMAVYYQGLDAFGHMYFDETPPEGNACRIEPSLMTRYYQVIDGYLGDWIAQLDEHTTVIVAADHGMLPGDGHGEHADNGLAMLYGQAIRSGSELRGMGVLDIAPLTLYLLDMAVPADMPGKPPFDAISARHLADQPVRAVASYQTSSKDAELVEATPEIEQEVVEKLRALGYVE